MSGEVTPATAFHPIAALLGIETRHTDALGVIHEPDAETLAAMVAAYGLPPDPGRAAAALAEMRAAAPLGLDPLQIVADEAPILDLPENRGTVDWQVEYEQGGQAAGIWSPGNGRLRLAGDIPLGYHRLDVSAGGTTAGGTIAGGAGG